ncbi:MAG: hypothetical protein WCT04_04845 [Planctomycetota bacterium]
MNTIRLVISSFVFALIAGGRVYALSSYESAPIYYNTAPVNDPVGVLIKKIEKKEASLSYDAKHGWLPALMTQLGVSAMSQTLVFSKTSLQRHYITPENPRALYFSEDVYLGWVKNGDVVEIASVDPQQGTIFYTLSQKNRERPIFTRQTHACLQCHDSSSQALGVPGLVMRSVYSDGDGMPIYNAGTYVTTQESPFKERWGGWYVTGNSGGQVHMGNVIVSDRDNADKTDFSTLCHVTDLTKKCEIDAYLAKTSDIAALMVAEHQTRMHNHITNANFEIRSALYQEREINKALGEPIDRHTDSTKSRVRSVAEPLLKYMLFSGEAALEAPVSGSPDFANEFSSRGPKDKAGRSLHELDLKRRLLKYPCSYLIYSDSFNGLPEMVLEHIRTRMTEILTGADTSKDYAHLSQDDRKAIKEILSETWKGAPKTWK